MTDNDHNAFVSMHEDLECDNPYSNPDAWDWDNHDDSHDYDHGYNYDDYDNNDYDHHREILYWWH